MRRLVGLVALGLAACTQPSWERIVSNLGEPVLTFEAPLPGAWLPSGETRIRGRGEHLESLKLDGESVEQRDGMWLADRALAKGLHTFEIEGRDLLGIQHSRLETVMVGPFARTDFGVKDAVAGRIERGALEMAMSGIASRFTPERMETMLLESNPVYSSALVDVSVLSADFADIDVGMDMGHGWLELTVHIKDIEMDLDVDAVADLTTRVNVASFESRARYAVRAAADGGIDVQPLETEAELIEPVFSVLPDWDWLQRTLETVLEEELEKSLTDMLPNWLADTVSTLTKGVPIPLRDTEATPRMSLTEVILTPDHAAARFDLAIDLADPPRHDAPGWLKMGVPAEVQSARGPVAITLSADAVNYLLHEIWRAGAFDRNLSSEDGTIGEEILWQSGADWMTLRLSPTLPPVVGSDEGPFTLRFGELLAEASFSFHGIENSLAMSVAGRSTIRPVVDGQELRAELEPPALRLDARQSDLGIPLTVLAESIEQALPIDDAVHAASKAKLRLPTLGGLSVVDASIEQDPANLWIHVDFDVRHEADAAGAVAD